MGTFTIHGAYVRNMYILCGAYAQNACMYGAYFPENAGDPGQASVHLGTSNLKEIFGAGTRNDWLCWRILAVEEREELLTHSLLAVILGP